MSAKKDAGGKAENKPIEAVEQTIHKKEHRAHLEVEAIDAAAGAAAGAALGILGGPVGVAAGAVLGAAAGAILGAEVEGQAHEEAEHEKELDDIERTTPRKKPIDEEVDL